MWEPAGAGNRLLMYTQYGRGEVPRCTMAWRGPAVRAHRPPTDAPSAARQSSVGTMLKASGRHIYRLETNRGEVPVALPPATTPLHTTDIAHKSTTQAAATLPDRLESTAGAHRLGFARHHALVPSRSCAILSRMPEIIANPSLWAAARAAAAVGGGSRACGR